MKGEYGQGESDKILQKLFPDIVRPLSTANIKYYLTQKDYLLSLGSSLLTNYLYMEQLLKMRANYIMPPIPPMPMPPMSGIAGAFGSGLSATTASVVKNIAATDAAF